MAKLWSYLWVDGLAKDMKMFQQKEEAKKYAKEHLKEKLIQIMARLFSTCSDLSAIESQRTQEDEVGRCCEFKVSLDYTVSPR